MSNTFFCYSPETGLQAFATESQRDEYCERMIIESMDDNKWTDDVESIIAGVITHSTQKTDIIARPDDSEIDEDGNDNDGEWWPAEVEYKCNYDLLPINQQPTQAVTDVIAERQRQIEKEGFDANHDKQNNNP